MDAEQTDVFPPIHYRHRVVINVTVAHVNGTNFQSVRADESNLRRSRGSADAFFPLLSYQRSPRCFLRHWHLDTRTRRGRTESSPPSLRLCVCVSMSSRSCVCSVCLIECDPPARCLKGRQESWVNESQGRRMQQLMCATSTVFLAFGNGTHTWRMLALIDVKDGSNVLSL